jgi:hypothetical protein
LRCLTVLDNVGFASEMVQYVPYVVLRVYGMEGRGYIEYGAAPGVIYQMDNEQNRDDDTPYYLDMMRAADAHNGRKVVIFNDSVGSTEADRWRRRQPALEYAYEHGHYVGLHCYGDVTKGDNIYCPMVDLEHPDGFKWFAGRVFWLYDLMPPNARPAFLATEAGAGGFQRNATPQQWLEDALRYDAICQRYDWYKGFALWTTGGSGPYGFERDDLNDRIYLLGEGGSP